MAGAGYKLFATGDVLTAAQVNTYLQEQVVMVFANSTARTTALSGVLAEGMVSYLKDTDALEIYSGSAWVGYGSGDITGITTGATSGLTGGVTSGTADLKLNTTAKGGLLVGTGSATVTELAVGSNNTVLTADSTTATGLKWATSSSGGVTSLASGSFSSAVTISSIDQTYNQLWFYFNFSNGADDAYIRVNGQTGNIYDRVRLSFTSSTVANATGASAWIIGGTGSGSLDACYMVFPDYANTTRPKGVNWTTASNTGSSDGGGGFGKIRSASAISSITITSGSGSFSGNYNLYGVK